MGIARPGARQVLAGIAVATGCGAYAVLSHDAAASERPGLLQAGILVAPVAAFALVAAWRSRSRSRWLALWFIMLAGLFLAREQVLAGSVWLLLVQHAAIHAGLCIAFGRTLATGSVPMVSRLAERVHGPLSPRLQRYTRAVTWAWVAYFALMPLASVLLFVLAPRAAWSVFINFLTLPLLLAMFAGEYAVRIFLIPREERAGFLESIASWQQMSRDKRAHPS